jgi:hypothetical protein
MIIDGKTTYYYENDPQVYLQMQCNSNLHQNLYWIFLLDSYE